MSDRPADAVSSMPTPPSKKPRNPVERVIVWGGIAIMLGVAAFEALHKYGYDSTVSRMRKFLSEETETYMKLSEVRPLISGLPTETKSPHARKAYNTIELKWPSLFKDYRVQLIVEREGNDPLVAGFSTPGGVDPAEEVANREAPPSSDGAHGAPTMPLAMTSTSGMGGGGQGRPGAAGRPGGGPGAGMGGGPPRGRGLLGLVQREEVYEELKLTAEQMDKLVEMQSSARSAFQALQAVPEAERPAAMKVQREEQEQAVSEVLDAAQFARLLQLTWRETGLASVERDDVAKGLGLSDEQREKLLPILADRQSGQRALREAPPEEAAQKRQAWDDQLRAVLTEDQAQQWEELLGSPAPEPAKVAPSAN